MRGEDAQVPAVDDDLLRGDPHRQEVGEGALGPWRVAEPERLRPSSRCCSTTSCARSSPSTRDVQRTRRRFLITPPVPSARFERGSRGPSRPDSASTSVRKSVSSRARSAVDAGDCGRGDRYGCYGSVYLRDLVPV